MSRCRATRTEEAVAPHRGVHREVERAARRAAPRVGDAVLAGDVQRRAAAGVKRVADEHGTGLTLHHSSGAEARADSVARHGHSPTAVPRIDRACSGRTCCWPTCLGLDEAEIDCLARTGTTVAMCPVTAAKGGAGLPEHGRMPELLAKGVQVALGWDSPNNSNHLDMVRTHEHGGPPVQGRPPGHDADPRRARARDGHAHGAQALGLGDEHRLDRARQEGRPRALRHAAARMAGAFNPVNNLVYNADGRSVHTVIVDGRVVVDAYRQTFVDEARLFARVQEIGERLLARTGVDLPRSRWPIV